MGRIYIRYLGFLLSAIGVFLVLSGFTAITGFAILDSLTATYKSVLGIVLFIIGIILANREGAGLERKVDVYSAKDPRKQGNENYHLVDPYLNFGAATVSLEEFKKGVRKIEHDSELIAIVRGEYEPPLVEMMNAGGEKAQIAREFLQVLGYVHKVGQEEAYSGLSEDEKKEIKVAFRDFSGNLTKQQRKILNMYDIEFDQGTNAHWHFKSSGANQTEAVAPGSPSDWRTGRNLASELIKIIDRSRKKKS